MMMMIRMVMNRICRHWTVLLLLNRSTKPSQNKICLLTNFVQRFKGPLQHVYDLIGDSTDYSLFCLFLTP